MDDFNFSLTLHAGLIVHLAALVQLSGFLLRDQLKLRALVALGNGLYCAFYYFQPATPLWDALFWSALMGGVNLVMIVVIAHSRRPRALCADGARVSAAFAEMEPGDFRRLMRLGAVRVAAEATELTRFGAVPDLLIYVMEGEIVIERPDRTVRAARPQFIGELGFLFRAPASATVTLAPGGRFIAWERDALAALMRRREPVARCVERAFNRDLAEKLRESHAAAPALVSPRGVATAA